MNLPIYQIDAFASQLFKGNPAAVIPLSEWIDDALMQAIAAENNLSETVFLVRRSGEPVINASPNPLVLDSLVGETTPEYEIRWFTPEVEINLCGHATLASAWVLFNLLDHPADTVVFHSASGPLTVERNGTGLVMDFPRWMPTPVDTPAYLAEVLGAMPVVSTHQYRDLLVELESEAAVLACQPDFARMAQYIDKLIVTARGSEVDFVSRFFAPGAGIPEDPVTGSAHSQLIPFWSHKLQKTELTAQQLSKRGGQLYCVDKGDRVLMGGNAIFYMKGEIYV